MSFVNLSMLIIIQIPIGPLTYYCPCSESDSTEITSFDALFTENGKDEVADVSESDGYLSEVLDLIPLNSLSSHITLISCWSLIV